MIVEVPDEMVFVPGGGYTMGSDRHYAEEAPAHRVRVDSFLMDRAPVTNRQFGTFADATGYVTVAEVAPRAEDYPGALPHMLKAGSLVFTPPTDLDRLDDAYPWWSYVFGASWRHPAGPESSIAGLDDHPVVHVTFADALAYAAWAGKTLPTEAEWEFAARGGLEAAEYAWGDEFMRGNHHLANTWQGRFPVENTVEDGFERTSPVGAYPENGFGLLDMIGNVWEWTSDFWADRHAVPAGAPCCGVKNPRQAAEAQSYDASQHALRIPRRVLKGGSHLCAPNYCRRYRPAARHAEPVDSSMSHIGFRCIRRLDA